MPAVASSLAQMGPEDVSARASRLARAFMDQGVTFDLDGEERPFPLDVVPRIFTGAEWAKVAAGVAQRVRALELFLADVYGAARIVSDGLIPHEVITSSPGLRAGGLRLLAAQRRAHPRGRDRRDPRRGRRVPRAGGQPPEPVGGELRAGQPRRHGAGAARAVLGPAHPDGDRLPGPPDQRAAPGRAGRRCRTRPWSCSPRACTTPPSTSTRCWPASWACTWWRGATSSATAPTSSCAPPRARCRCT